ncbi:MAG TPA: hypothetical protein VGT82_07045 [Ktedonobacteraceae bacterium]|nr:hypothetical protein [Ktedonobacteraceae bacterium]
MAATAISGDLLSIRFRPPDDCLRQCPRWSQLPNSLQGRIRLLMEEQLRMQRVLLVLDNLEALLEEGAGTGHLRTDFEEYANLLHQVGETAHQK